MARGASFLNVVIFVSVVILVSAFIGPSTGCFTTETIDKERQWACWNFNREGGYTSKDTCCAGTICECDETGSYTTNARFGRDCKCATTATFVEEYYTRIMAEQQERINIMQRERQEQQEEHQQEQQQVQKLEQQQEQEQEKQEQQQEKQEQELTNDVHEESSNSTKL